MTAQTTASLADLYEADETAWLEVMAKLAAERRAGDFDYDNLCEFLTSMANRDRRELYSRLIILLTHILKWEFQPERRGSSWRTTIRTQQRELRFDVRSGTLRNYGAEVFADCYAAARVDAADETGLPVETFPAVPPWTLPDVLAWEPAAE